MKVPGLISLLRNLNKQVRSHPRATVFSCFLQDTAGSYVVMGAMLMPVMIGAVGLGVDYGLWQYTHQSAQSAADSAAVSAANDGKAANIIIQAKAVAASYGFVDGQQEAVVTVNQPPKTGKFTSTADAVEVIVQRSVKPNFASIFLSGPVQISARSVATPKSGFGCILALNATASSAISITGSGSIDAPNCDIYDNSSSSSAFVLSCCGTSLSANTVNIVGGASGSGIKATKGIFTGSKPLADPYAAISYPPYGGCTWHNPQLSTNWTLSPGVYCGGLDLKGNATVTLLPGIYYMDRGSLSLGSRTELRGTGVTIVLTSSTGSDWATASFAAGSTVDLTAPTSGPTAGIVIFGDRKMDVGTKVSMQGGSSQTLNGSIYLPKAALSFSGGSSTTVGCNQIVADTITFSGNGNLSVDCTALGTKSVKSAAAKLVE